MKKVLLIMMSCCALAFSSCTQEKSTTEQTQAVTAEPTKMLRHIVLVKFKDASSPEDVKTVEDAFRKLPSQIKEIKGFEWGLNNSPEGKADGFTHAFFVSFESEADREVYLPHPQHKEFVDVLVPHLDKVLVFDYWAGE